jgi:4-hydroxybenzoate polyprenyltransferase
LKGFPRLKREIDGLIRLSRIQEYVCFVMVTTLLGAIASKGSFGWQLGGVLVANWLAVAFAFMFNDLEDAPEDALNPKKFYRNPVSCRDLSPRSARIASVSVALLAAFTFALLGLWPFILGTLCLLLGFGYSWRPVRLKTLPFLDLASHGLMLAGLQFLTAYFTFQPSSLSRWLPPFLFIVAISLYGELFNELRDLEEDRKAGLTHTATWLGEQVTYGLMMTIFAVGIFSALYTVVVVQLIPGWVLLLMVAMTAVLILRPLLELHQRRTHLELQQSFQKPLEIAAASALMINFIETWITTWLGGKLL